MKDNSSEAAVRISGSGLAAEKGFAGRWVCLRESEWSCPDRTYRRTWRSALRYPAFLPYEYLWSENLSITAHFDYYSITIFRGLGTLVLDKGVTESVAGFSYRLTPISCGKSTQSRISTSLPEVPQTSHFRHY